MKKELTTRVFQAAVAKLDAATHGSVNEMYTIAEISDILEAYRNKLASNYNDLDVPDMEPDELVNFFCEASKLFQGKECAWCDQCGRLSQSGYVFEGEFYCSRECAINNGYTEDDVNFAAEGCDTDAYFIDLTL